ncbi:MAG: phosphate ABC transporter substrate-binding protein PstS, partial [Ramlibacter sp.]|nr:phosphate ABC transporter substrate-binding protein PstS [Ramlibacter sp.]
MNNQILRTAALSLAGFSVLSFAGTAAAQDATGAGASFPAPLYSKWASDYNKATGA